MRASRPSETDQGRRWLANFSSSDVGAATLLIDSLKIVSNEEIRDGLTELLQGLEDKNQIGVPALPVQVLEMNDIREIIGPVSHPVAYVDYFPGSVIKAFSGSEALVGQVLRKLQRRGWRGKSKLWLDPESDLPDLKLGKCRSLVLVTDYCGSGQQVIESVQFFMRNRTLRSWRSAKWIKIYLATFAISPEALQMLISSKLVDDVHFVLIADSIQTIGWTERQRQSILALCRANALPNPQLPILGFRNSAGLYVNTSSVPDNLPAVFLQTGANWSPLFAAGEYPGDLKKELASYSPEPNYAVALSAMNELKLTRSLEARVFPVFYQRVLLVLVLSMRHVLTSRRISTELKISRDESEGLLRFLLDEGLIDSQYSVTPSGRMELEFARRLPRSYPEILTPNVGMYYPQQLR